MTELDEYPRETVEAVPVTVRRAGTVVTNGVEFAVVHHPARPVVWRPAVILQDGSTAAVLDGLVPGRHDVFARVPEAGSYSPVIECGSLEVT